MKALNYLLMRQEIAAPHSFFAPTYGVNEAALLVDIPRHDLLDQFNRVATC